MNASTAAGSVTRALERGLLVVEALATNGPATLASLSEQTRLSNATLLRILKTLEHHRWIARRPTDGCYELAQKIDSFMVGRLHVMPLAEIVNSVLSRLPERLDGWASEVAAPIAPGQIAVLASNHRMKAVSTRARREEQRAALGMNLSMTLSSHGRAALAFLDADERVGHLHVLMHRGRREERRWLERGMLHAVIRDARSQGYAVREYDFWVEPYDFGPDVDSLAVPILVEGVLQATLSIVWTTEATERRVVVQNHLVTLQGAADEIAEQIRGAGLAAPRFFTRPETPSG